MSLFRKPKKRIQRRVVFGCDDDEDDQNGDAMEVEQVAPTPPPPPIIRMKEKKDKDKSKVKTKAVLSFEDEEEEGEVFQVKKSSQSKKLQRMLDRERKRNKERDSQQERLMEVDIAPTAEPVSQELSAGADGDNISNNSRKNDSYFKHTSPEGLILSGRAAIVAGATGDVDSDSSETEVGEQTHHRFTALHPSRDTVRAVLDKGGIPDAALIHAARKTRQQAREFSNTAGSAPPFIPIGDSAPAASSTLLAPGTGGRLVREDGDGDASDEDAGRMQVRGVIVEDRKLGVGGSDAGSEPESGGEEWETQQIRKAVSGAQLQPYAVPMHTNGVDVNPFSLHPPPLPVIEQQSPHLQLLEVVSETGEKRAPSSAAELLSCLRERHTRMKLSQDVRRDALAAACASLEGVREAGSRARVHGPRLDARYKFFQRLRGYLTDLLECLDEKMPELEQLESRALALHKKQASFLLERRRADVRDQAQDVLALSAKLAARPEAPASPTSMEAKQRRAAEREGRRLRRRRARDAAAGVRAPHRDGDSSDDEVPPAQAAAYALIADGIRADANALFADTLPEFSTLRGVAERMAEWRRHDLTSYTEAYAADCLHKLLAPFVRLEILLWNPITDKDPEDYEKMSWYKTLTMYGVASPHSTHSEMDDTMMEVDGENAEADANSELTEEAVAADPDLMLLPNIMLKVVLPKIVELIDGTWDPLSVRATVRARRLTARAAALPGARPDAGAAPRLATALADRLAAALAHDVFVPLLARSILESRGASFFNRQVASGARLLRSALSLAGVLADSLLAKLAVHQLLDRYLLAAVRCCGPVAGADICWLLVSSVPRSWLATEEGRERLAKLTETAHAVKGQLHSDNPLHLKGLEQIRSVLAQLTPSENKQ